MTTSEHIEAAQVVKERRAARTRKRAKAQPVPEPAPVLVPWSATPVDQNAPCFYASCMDAGRTALVLGPFSLEAECREWAYKVPEDGGDFAKHNLLVKEACNRDAKAWFYSWGMVKMLNGFPAGKLNAAVGYKPAAVGPVVPTSNSQGAFSKEKT